MIVSTSLVKVGHRQALLTQKSHPSGWLFCFGQRSRRASRPGERLPASPGSRPALGEPGRGLETIHRVNEGYPKHQLEQWRDGLHNSCIATQHEFWSE